MEISKLISGIGQYDKTKVEKSEAETANRRSKSASAAGSGGDKVSLSAEAKVRTETFKAANETPEVRRELVDAIKARIDAGEYEIDSNKIAEKLIKDDLESLF